MRKIRIFEHISLDGVIEHDENYPYGAWTMPFRSAEGMAMLLETYGTTFDLFLGRRTYDAWLAFWPKAGDFPMANAINAAHKYVATHRSEGLDWGPVKQLGSDIVDELDKLKSTEGPDLILAGSISLISPLLTTGLVDEVVLIVYPVLLGKGKRILANHFNARRLEYKSTLTTPTGVMINTYKYVGPLQK